MTTTVEEDGSTSERVELHHVTNISSNPPSLWGTEWFQTYWQLEDPTQPGTYTGLTCNAQFNQEKGYATLKEVKNFRGSKSLKTADDYNS